MSRLPSAGRYITACPAGCGADFSSSEIELPEGRLLRCRACGQLVSQIGEAAYQESTQAFDAPDYNLPDEDASARRVAHATRRLTRVCELVGKPAPEVRVLDVGCSRGDFVAAAQALGFDAEGVEPAPHLAEAGRAAGRKIHNGRIDQQSFPDSSFDAATLFEVIEHLREPIPTLRELRRVLKPRGVLLVSTGNAASWTAKLLKGKWDYLQTRITGGHVSFFNPASLALTAQRAGFAVADLHTARVRLVTKEMAPAPVYLVGKALAELLNYPARVFGTGHDMIAYLRRED